MDTYLVTGGMGCIGAWAIYHLVQQGKRVVCFDISDDRHRIDWLMSPEEQNKIIFHKGDLTQYASVKEAFDQHRVTHVIHLGALQIPMCRANPVVGAQVNVTGTANIFEAVIKTGLKHVVFASSIAVYGSASDYDVAILPHDALKKPRTLYGSYKVCNEQMAQVYYADHQMTSICFRPYTVYGVGRDQGLTSEPTKAMAAAVRGEDYQINFGGMMQFHYASDVALQFIHAIENPLDGAYAFNMGTPAVSVASVAEMIMARKPNVKITVNESPLPFPQACDPSPLYQQIKQIYETPLETAITETIAHFERLQQAGIAF